MNDTDKAMKALIEAVRNKKSSFSKEVDFKFLLICKCGKCRTATEIKISLSQN